ncbi:Carboxylase OS=Lysinibacillus sphaericus CBAM5 OX=1400869 GN=P799_00285 PE=4 SV=1 [Lysinibacillus sphaericus]
MFPKYHDKNAQQGKLFVRERLELLLDDGLQSEDGLYANCLAGDLPADGVITGIGKIHGRTVCVLANDSTIKAGSWGKRTVEKMIRIQETAEKLNCWILLFSRFGRCAYYNQLEMFQGVVAQDVFSTIR